MGTPLVDMLKAYQEGHPLPFHMPGHILGRGLSNELKRAGSLDITEIPGSDCLHAPTGAIKEAQELAAKCFGAGFTLFLVNGSTAGIQTMIKAVVKPGGKLIVGRDSHRSVINALALFGGEPVFVMPSIDEESDLPWGVTAEAIERAILDHENVQGVLLTRPSYYGAAASLEEIRKVTRRHGLPLLVDEAHGAHFGFHRELPPTALEQGADLCVQSLHKTLPALTQTALLHGQKDLELWSKVESAASMLQSTSPSYLLMASIDSARNLMENEGEALYDRLLSIIKDFDRSLETRTRVKRLALKHEGLVQDFSRIVLSFEQTRLSGYEAEELLRTRYGIVAEMADLIHVVLIATPFHSREDFDRLIHALQMLSQEFKGENNRRAVKWPMHLPEKVLTLGSALSFSGHEVPIKEALNKICGGLVVPYPPGIPLLNPGERITGEILDYIEAVISQGCRVHGCNDGKLPILPE